MILYACVVRLQDGLPLSASTDFHINKNLIECKKKLRALTRSLSQKPKKGTAKECELSIHFSSAEIISSLTICSCSYPLSMAFCFLDELIWEFNVSYNHNTVAMASKPYAFLEFDRVIQRVKHNFNYTSSSPEDNGSDSCPDPIYIKLEDGEEPVRNGYGPTQEAPAPVYKLAPVTSLGILSLLLNIMCGALNGSRGSHLFENSFQYIDENAGSVAAFITAFVAHLFQCYLYLYYCPGRKLKTCCLLVIICSCNLYLYGLRNVWQILFHIGAAAFSTIQTVRRNRVTGRCGPEI
ncbi:vesicle-trafficking protein SEC22c [Pelodytes ibericus]